MPELPEVETIRKDLEKKIIGKKIVDIKIVQKKSIKNSLSKFIEVLKNNYVISAKRKGKLLILELNDKELQRLYNSIKNILNLAIKHRGTTFSDYVGSSGRKGNFAEFLKVYGREKEGCKNCGKESIKKIKLAGRATRYCEWCQK